MLQVYAVYFKCNKRLIREYSNLRNYTAEIYQMPGNGDCLISPSEPTNASHMCNSACKHDKFAVSSIALCAYIYMLLTSLLTPVLLRRRGLTCMLCCPILSPVTMDAHQP